MVCLSTHSINALPLIGACRGCDGDEEAALSMLEDDKQSTTRWGFRSVRFTFSFV